MIHLCQHKAYSNAKNIELADAEKAAGECFIPLLMIRRHAQIIMTNAETDYNTCLKSSNEEYKANIGTMNKDRLDANCMNCLTEY